MNLLNYLRNKATTHLLLAGLTVGLVTGCDRKEIQTELSDILHEDAKVISTDHKKRFFQPIMIGKMLSGISHPAVYKVTFDGEVDFEIDNKEIYDRFNRGDIVDVLYRKSYQLTFEDLNKDGKKEQISRILTGYEFLDAQPKK